MTNHALSRQFLSSLLAHKNRHLLISNLATDTGMTFVLVQHLDPEHHSMLIELFSKRTTMRVKEVTNGMTVEPNHVYVIPPNATMSISNHTMQLAPRGELPPEMTHSASAFCASPTSLS